MTPSTPSGDQPGSFVPLPEATMDDPKVTDDDELPPELDGRAIEKVYRILEIDPLMARRNRGTHLTLASAAIAVEHIAGRDGREYDAYAIDTNSRVIIAYYHVDPSDGAWLSGRQYLIIEEPLQDHATPGGFDPLAEVDGVLRGGQ